MESVDVLIVGAGPAGLAAAIRLKQKLDRAAKTASVVVVDKALKPGAHNLSGAVLESDCLEELFPGWQDSPFFNSSEMPKVTQDEMYFMTERSAIRVPPILVPAGMHHHGDRIISLTRLVDGLTRLAVSLGVEILHGFSVESLIWDNNAIKGVKLIDCGLDQDRRPKPNYIEGEIIHAKVTVLASGAMGILARDYACKVGGMVNPQVYSLGIKQIIRLPKGNSFGVNRVVHTLGFPNHSDIFGGGFIYSYGEDQVALGLITGLDWKYTDYSLPLELEIFKSHPFIDKIISGGEVVAAGAKVIPEGGYYSLPKVYTHGGLVAGDAAGFVNMEKIKGIHYAIYSGMAAADAVFEALLSNDFTEKTLRLYHKLLEIFGVIQELHHARNFRQVFQAGLFIGAPLSLIQSWWPWKIRQQEDRRHTDKKSQLNRKFKSSLDRVTMASLSGAMHREDEPPHTVIVDRRVCSKCKSDFAAPCTAFCPVEVYRWHNNEIILSPSNCLHCGTCALKCPCDNIIWKAPEGGEGPQYKTM